MALIIHHTAQKVKFSIKGFFSKCDQIRAVSNYGIICYNLNSAGYFVFARQYGKPATKTGV